jgi:hypothetical protein
MAFAYEVVARTRAGNERRCEYASEDALGPGSLILLAGRWWLVERVEAGSGEAVPRCVVKPARYRIRLRHPDGYEEVGALRRFRSGAPRLGHALSTVEDDGPASWQVVSESLEHDEDGDPYLELLAERDYAELEEEALPDHELEHALASREEESLPAGVVAMLGRAEQLGLALELVALEPGVEPDWASAEMYIDSLVLEEIEDDLLELCGVDPDEDRRDAWLPMVKERLQADLRRLREDVEGRHDEIEEWDFRGGRVFASVGSVEDERDPDRGHGWLCRLVDSGVLAAAGFVRVRKAEL